MKFSVFKQICFFVALLSFTLVFAQEEGLFPIDKYKDYTDLPRESIFTHLNKSVLIKGEMLGFTTYVFEKNRKEPFKQTTTVYCTITDDSGTIVKKKMLKTENGIAFNAFNIDSSFTTGDYTFRAFTNWMLNFNEPNYFETKISIIDPASVDEKTPSGLKQEIDIQILPEGGHLIEDCQNTIAVIAKNRYGFGVPNLEGKILNSEGKAVALFRLNDLGIGKTIFTPVKDDSYKLIVENVNFNINQTIENIKTIGFNISALVRNNKLILSFKTNKKTLDIIENDDYNIVIHNGKDLKTLSFSFNNEREAIRIFDTSTLFSGINIITVFNSQNKPILERLFFNHRDIKKASLEISNKIILRDSIEIKLLVNQTIDTLKTNNVSVSILPTTSKSYVFNNNILSKLYLEPYVNGTVENGSYYFSNSETKTKYALDNLLISQGWSSYDWNEIFNNPPTVTYNFDKGISANVHINDKSNEETYFTYPLTHNRSQVIALDDKDNSYRHEELFPLENEEYKIISGFKKLRLGKKPNVYIQFFPSSFPEFSFKTNKQLLSSEKITPIKTDLIDDIGFSWGKDIEVLDEVLITANVKEERQEKLRNKFYGDVDVFDDKERRRNLTFANYISTRGFVAQEFNGNFSIRPRVQTTTSTSPLIFLDDVLLTNYSAFLYQFYMNTVDYVVVNTSGFGEGMRGAAGVIRIFTNPKLAYTASNKKVLTSIAFPLAFASPKNFYTPKYQKYNNNTFNQFGVIAWEPNLTYNENGELMFKIPDTYQESITLFIEGVINDKTLISEKKTITFK